MPDDYAIEFWEDEKGRKPVLQWIRDDLTREQRAALGKAMQHVLATMGIGVCGTQFGKQLGEGLCEFRLRYNLAELRHRFEDKPAPADASDSSERSSYACSSTPTEIRSSFCCTATTRARIRRSDASNGRSPKPGDDCAHSVTHDALDRVWDLSHNGPRLS